MLAPNTYRMEVSENDGPTARQTSSDNRDLPPWLLSSTLPVAHIPTDTAKVQTRAEIAEIEVQSRALEMEISYLEGESKEKRSLSWAALIAESSALGRNRRSLERFLGLAPGSGSGRQAKVANLEAQIHTLKQVNPYAARVLTIMANTTGSHRFRIG